MPHTAIDRRRILRAGLIPFASFALPAVDALALTDYPSRQIRVVIGFPPGTGTDIWARAVAGGLTTALGQAAFVENKPGAHGQLGCTSVKNAEKDGYTLLYGAGGTMAINMALYGKRLSYDTLRDFEPVIGMERSTLYLAVNKDLPITNVKEMVAYVKARQGKLNFGSAGTGTTAHLAMEMLKKATGMEITHVPYKGGGAVLQDMMGGQIQFAFDAAAVMLPQRSAGTIRLIAVSSPARQKLTPDIPTVAEQGVPGFQANVWSGLFAPAGTPKAVIAKLNEVLNAGIKSGVFDPVFNSIGAEHAGGSSDDFRKFVGEEIVRWTTVVRDANVQVD